MRLILEEQQKYLQSFINNVTYHLMNPDADVTYQIVKLFSSNKCFIYFISDVPHYIRWNQHNTVCTILVKVDVLDTCGAMICSYFGIAFLLFFMKIENTVNTSSQNSMLLFIDGLINDIMNIRNKKSLDLEWITMLGRLNSVNDGRFSWPRNVFLKYFRDWLNYVQQCHWNFRKDAGQKMFISWQTYEGLKIIKSLKQPNFFFDIKLSMYWQSAFVKIPFIHLSRIF